MPIYTCKFQPFLAVIDGIAMIQQLDPKKPQGHAMFVYSADFIFHCLVSMASTISARAIHFVTNTQMFKSKIQSKQKRAPGGSHRIKVYEQALPQQWNKFLACGVNKEENCLW